MRDWPDVRARLVEVSRLAGLSDVERYELLDLVSDYGKERFRSGVVSVDESRYDLLMNDAEHTQGGVTGSAHPYQSRWAGSSRGRQLFQRAVDAEVHAAQFEPGTPEHKQANEDLSTATTEWRNHKD